MVAAYVYAPKSFGVVARAVLVGLHVSFEIATIVVSVAIFDWPICVGIVVGVA